MAFVTGRRDIAIMDVKSGRSHSCKGNICNSRAGKLSWSRVQRAAKWLAAEVDMHRRSPTMT